MKVKVRVKVGVKVRLKVRVRIGLLHQRLAPVPSPLVKSPPCSMKPGMIRWKQLPMRWSGWPPEEKPFSPVHRARKFSAVLGTCLPYRPHSMRPAASPPIESSRKTRAAQWRADP